MKIMHQEIIPIPVRPWTLNGISERMLVSHYENDYGGAVRALNAVRAELAALDAKAPGSRLRALKREELIAMGSVALHELYFGNLGGEGNKIPDNIRAILEEHFGSVAAWRREFVGTAQSLAGGSGWVLLTWSRRQGGSTTRSRSITRRRPSTPRPCLRWICTSTRITSTSARMPRPTSMPSCATSTGLPWRSGWPPSTPIARCRATTPPTRACRRSPSRSWPHGLPRASPCRSSTHGRGTTSRGRWT